MVSRPAGRLRSCGLAAACAQWGRGGGTRPPQPLLKLTNCLGTKPPEPGWAGTGESWLLDGSWVCRGFWGRAFALPTAHSGSKALGPGSRTASGSRPTRFPFTAARRPGRRPRARLAEGGSNVAEEIPRGRDPHGGIWPRQPCVSILAPHLLGSVNKATRLPSTTCVLAHWVGRALTAAQGQKHHGGCSAAWEPGGHWAPIWGSGPETPGLWLYWATGARPWLPAGSACGFPFCRWNFSPLEPSAPIQQAHMPLSPPPWPGSRLPGAAPAPGRL